jgi:hypothetical protein
MSAKPNFDAALQDDDTKAVTVSGTSDPSDFEDIVSIQVILAQGKTIGSGDAGIAHGGAKASSSWTAIIDEQGFVPGDAVAVGVERRLDNHTTTTWAQSLKIE